MFSPKFTFFAKKVAGGYTPFAVVFKTPGTSTYTVPIGATSMKAWVIGRGGGGNMDNSGCALYGDGHNGGEAVRTYSVTGGGTVSYTVGSKGTAGDGYYGPTATDGTSSIVTYGSPGVTITGGGGSAEQNNADGVGSNGTCNRTFYKSNWTGASCTGTPAATVDFQGRNTAVSLSGSTMNETTTGSGGTGTSSGSTDGKPGGVVLYFN